MTVLADTHCHLNFDFLRGDFDKILKVITCQDIGMLVVPSVDSSTWGQIIDLCVRDERLFYALGLHPLFIAEHCIDDIKELEFRLDKDGVNETSGLVAIGEIGLDYFASEHEKQLRFFEAQLSLAEKFSLPVILHSRKAHSDILYFVKKYRLVGGVIHAFSGSYELMMQYVDSGFKLGIGPVITWPSASKTREAIRRAPIESLVLETDSPDMAVHGCVKGKGSPLDVIKVFDTLCSIRSESREYIKHVMWLNSQNLFNCPIN